MIKAKRCTYFLAVSELEQLGGDVVPGNGRDGLQIDAH